MRIYVYVFIIVRRRHIINTIAGAHGAYVACILLIEALADGCTYKCVMYPPWQDNIYLSPILSLFS